MARKHARERKTADLRRKSAKRPAYDRLLIVCEGSKTEPNYFEEIRQDARISSAHITVLPSAGGTAPINVVESAITEFQKTRAYERVYAVFDRDDHASYANAIAKAQATRLTNDEKKDITFEAAVSVPSFELWFLLHFADVKAFLHRSVVFDRLREHVAGYNKGSEGMYARTKALLQTAIARANWLKENNARIPGTEAYTDIHELTGRLVRLRSA